MAGRAGGVAICALAATLLAAAAPAARPHDHASVALSILPPGESGTGGKHATDQMRLYDALTPLRAKVTAATLRRLYKPETLGATGKTRRESTPRPGLRILRDRWGVAHVYGRTALEVMWGAGWVAAEDRGLILQLVRGPGRIAALDGPAYDQSRELVPSAGTEAALAAQYALVRKLGKRGRQLIAQVDAYTAGLNAFWKASKTGYRPWTRNDTVAAAAVLAGRFGVGGGDEARRAELLAELQVSLGAQEGRRVWDDLREQQDPETPVTAAKAFPYGRNTSEAGNVVPDVGSVGLSVERAAAAAQAQRRTMSNALVVSARRSASGHPIYVAGPQVGYSYPAFFLEIDLHGGGFDARGVSFPGVPWIVIGRGPDYAWSATTSHSDIVDQYVETLCSGDDTHYVYRGQCLPMGSFDAGVVKGPPDRVLSFRTTVHGPVVGYATVQGKKVAISTKRSTRGREIVSGLALDDLDKGRVHSAKEFLRTMNQVEFAFNWTYADDRDIAYFSSGRLPIRPASVNLGLPTNGNGDYEWRGFEPMKAHPQAIDPRGGALTNWNNKPARGFAAADDHWSYGSLQRVQMLSGLGSRRKWTVAQVVGLMNRAATEDFRGRALLPVLEVLSGTTAPSARDAQMLQLLEVWRRNGASRLDRDLDGKVDDPGAAIMDAAWPRIARAVMTPVLGPLVAELEKLQPLDDPANDQGSAFDSGWYGYVAKDLRSLLGVKVSGPFSHRYCGAGVLAACRASLWGALDAAGTALAAAQGSDPAKWRS
ncbi:MAG TPA: penicillin acylase family protein, partial [Gaiellaceae bacterium]|nr:penicillin acylase family protein [Gaiellaceae bacterium]